MFECYYCVFLSLKYNKGVIEMIYFLLLNDSCIES